MPDRVFCDQHDPKHCAKWVNASRPLFDDICPYCEIDRLKGELEELKSDLYRAVSANGLYSQQASNLERQLASARQEAARECLEIISMETIDRPFEQSQAAEIIKAKFKLEE